ncbi:MAG TPA: response regulator transcription factor, partial [Thermoanaerobaculia bacterium]|nr:response regulator transcription factor [Thermoanaerobaculia bacterium]
MIRVVLVEDQNLVRQGLRSLLALATDIEVVGEAENGDAALRLIPEARPDVVLLDIRMPGKSGIDVLEELKKSNALPPTLILTTFDDDALLLRGIAAGARGYLLKDVTLETLT